MRLIDVVPKGRTKEDRKAYEVMEWWFRYNRKTIEKSIKKIKVRYGVLTNPQECKG